MSRDQDPDQDAVRVPFEEMTVLVNAWLALLGVVVGVTGGFALTRLLTTDAVLEMLRRSNQEFKQTVLMITHNPEAAAIGDRILHMRDGRLLDA